ncbi:glycosyl transferase family 36 [Rhodanobacter sp. L36]|uniref:GH36-type glycosyl hydrolase domain-containing protein n=1 Tax=Rhodanobacter sp. L36 TaxID=1747221 RepID=UPI00131B655F|nr:glycosyl transferase family 36 [Rhodanobacter sp. L36]
MSKPPSPQRSARTLLSNGRYTVMLGANGSGFSQWNDLAVTRWREDRTVDGWGSYLLLRDEESGTVWSATPQPIGIEANDEATFDAGRATFRREHDGVHSTLDIAVAHDADIELRRLTLRNKGDRTRMLSITSYAELVIGSIGGDNAHPAFSKMFVQTEWDAESDLLLATRRQRADSEPKIWAAHALQVVGETGGTVEHDTDRASFLGRDRSLRNAQAMQADVVLAGNTGCVLDPVFSLRRFVTLEPGASACVLSWMCLADSREAAMKLTTRLANADRGEALINGAMQYAQTVSQASGIDAAHAGQLSQRLAALLVSDPSQRAPAHVLARGRGGAPTLWAAGISGDRPILLIRLDTVDAMAQVRDAVAEQNQLRSQRLAFDIVILNAARGPDGDAVQAALDDVVKSQQQRLKSDDHLPKVELFVLRDDAISDALRDGLLTVARVVVGVAQDASADAVPEESASVAEPIRATTAASAPDAPTLSELEFANGSGGFSDDGREYRIELDDERRTPAPWVNVIANPAFGFLVSAEGGGYTWSLNSQQNALTPWPNDPVSDSPHDVFYLRDEDNGDVWSATALPVRVTGASYVATHGKGWSRFTTDAHGIGLELTQCVPVADSVKLSRLCVVNRSDRTRHLSVTGYVGWMLGGNGSTPAPFVVTSRDEATAALFAVNHWRPDFGDRVAFFDMGGVQQSMCGDRGEFLGALGHVADPAALRDNTPLSGSLGAGMDPCGALQARITLPPHTQIEVTFALGDAASEADAQALIARYRDTDMDSVLADVAAQWIGVLDAVQVQTPDRAMDVLINDWLLYQVLACRVWARTAYYQASGAYGFRDQLQDVMALCVSRPDLAREHLLRAAGRQFAEGDVQHWWLPPGGQGIRTKIRDDRIWLAYVAMHYASTSGDHQVLEEALPFLVGQAIPDNASDAFFQPSLSDQSVSLYEHCARALDSSLTRGAHGLPLIGTGDWNDGMNAVGEKGRGESVWLGWFLLDTISRFAPHATERGENERAGRWLDYADDLRGALEESWDGEWYRRGYYDDGTPLGSKDNDECRIDVIAQSWSVLAGTNNQQHASAAMASVDRLLVDHDNGIAELFTPPFDHSAQNPGYIKGYPPGVRENGGQYTHGATWSIFAWAKLGDGDRAAALFDLLNPIRHSDSAEAVERYKVEPYVVSADVYSVAPHVGRGGWTWYTGSAAWLYRAGLEAVLGFHLLGDRLRIDPCIPKAWPGFGITFQYRVGGRMTRYEIGVENPDGVCRGVAFIEMDGQMVSGDGGVNLVDDGGAHVLRVVLGSIVV